MVCNFCQKKGHIRSQCYALKRAEARKRESDPSVVQHVVLKTNELDNTKQQENDTVKVNKGGNKHSHSNEHIMRLCVNDIRVH